MAITFKSKTPLRQAQAIAHELRSLLLAVGLERAEVAGSVRRGKSEVGDLDIVVQGDLTKVREAHGAWTWMEGGDRKATLSYKGMQVNLVASLPEEWGSMLLYFTGPRDYNIAYRARAKRMGLKLNEHGLWRGEERIAGRTEDEVYQALGKRWKAPSQRGK